MMTFPRHSAVSMAAIAALAFGSIDYCCAQSSVPAAPNGVPMLVTTGDPAAPGAGEVYEEYFNYSATAKRSYSPGYTPHVTSLFENPRDYPWALGALATPYYQYCGQTGWFFGSPRGYQTSVPPNSHAHAYFSGELGITSNMRYGYPEGLRVIEPVVVPASASVKKGGFLITGGGVTEVDITAQSAQMAPPVALAAPPMPAAPPLSAPPPPPAPPARWDREMLEK